LQQESRYQISADELPLRIVKEALSVGRKPARFKQSCSRLLIRIDCSAGFIFSFPFLADRLPPLSEMT